MFFSGLLSSILGLFVMNNLEESPFWQELQKAKAAKPSARPAPLRDLFGSSYRTVLFINILITFGGGGAYYLTSGYLPSFFKVVNGLPNNISSVILMAGSVTTIIATAGSGALSQAIGRKWTFILVGIVGAIAFPWLYTKLGVTRDVTEITIYSLLIIFIGNASYGPVMIFLNERFPTQFRATGTGLSWNIGFAIGGIMPTVVTAASGTMAGIPHVLAISTSAISVVYLIGALLIGETKDKMQ
jgi:MFS transporter, MHS family, proline/betaine transporter